MRTGGGIEELAGDTGVNMTNVLEGRVALVTGASKNIGKGIAIQVAASGATTYVTARSLEDTPGRLASLERTVAEAEAARGRGIAVACDHGDDEQVASLFRRIVDEQGRLDLVVNVASPDFSTMVGVPFWELPFDDITRCLHIGPRSDYVTTALAAVRDAAPGIGPHRQRVLPRCGGLPPVRSLWGRQGGNRQDHPRYASS